MVYITLNINHKSSTEIAQVRRVALRLALSGSAGIGRRRDGLRAQQRGSMDMRSHETVRKGCVADRYCVRYGAVGLE